MNGIFCFDRWVANRFAVAALALSLFALVSCSGSNQEAAPGATATPAATSAPAETAATPAPTASAETTAPAATPAAAPAQGGKAAGQPVTADDLKRLGCEPYGEAAPEKMRRYIVGPVEEIDFWFPESDPAVGKTTGIKKTFPTKAGQTYRVSVEFYDGYQDTKYPNHIAQKVTADGETLDTHDISVPAFFGWRTIDKTITAKGPSTDVCAFLEVVGPLETYHWGYASHSIVRNITLTPAQ